MPDKQQMALRRPIAGPVHIMEILGVRQAKMAGCHMFDCSAMVQMYWYTRPVRAQCIKKLMSRH